MLGSCIQSQDLWGFIMQNLEKRERERIRCAGVKALGGGVFYKEFGEKRGERFWNNWYVGQ